MIKGLFKLIFGLIRLVFFAVILVLIFHTWVIKQALTFSMSYTLGADVSIQKIKMDWKNTGFEIHGLEIGNPYDFPRGILAAIPLAIVSIDIPSLIHGEGPHIKTLGFDVEQLQVMSVSRKGLNILALKPLQRENNPESTSQPKSFIRTQAEKYSPQLIIDELIVSLGDITYRDMSGPIMQQKRFRVGIRGATYRDVRGTEDVTVIIVNEALKKLGIGFFNSQIQKIENQSRSSEDKPKGFLARTVSAIKDQFSK